MAKDKILITILDGTNSPLSGFPISQDTPSYYGRLSELGIGTTLHLVYNNGEEEAVRLANVETSVTDNPLSGMTEVTIKLQLKKEEKE